MKVLAGFEVSLREKIIILNWFCLIRSGQFNWMVSFPRKSTSDWSEAATLDVHIVAERHVAGRVLCGAGVHLAINQAHVGDPQGA